MSLPYDQTVAAENQVTVYTHIRECKRNNTNFEGPDSSPASRCRIEKKIQGRKRRIRDGKNKERGEENNDGKLSINNSNILPVAQKHT